MIRWLRQWWVRHRAPLPPRATFTEEDLIESFSIIVAFRCPCGSKILHQVGFLHEMVDCRRCGRHLAIREMSYQRPAPGDQPTVKFSIGYIVTRDELRSMRPEARVQ